MLMNPMLAAAAACVSVSVGKAQNGGGHEWRRQTREAEPHHDMGKVDRESRSCARNVPVAPLARDAGPFAVAGAVGGEAGVEDADEAAEIEQPAVHERREIGSAREISSRSWASRTRAHSRRYWWRKYRARAATHSVSGAPGRP